MSDPISLAPEPQGEARTLEEKIASLIRTDRRDRVHAAFKVPAVDGSCSCPYCTRDADQLADMVANYELDLVSSQQKVAQQTREIAELKAALASALSVALRAAQTKPGWMVVRQRETDPPEVWKFDDEREARAFHDRAQAQWSDCYLVSIVKQGAQRDAPSSSPVVSEGTLRWWVESVVEKFEQDEAQGYHTKDRAYALDMLRQGLKASSPEKDGSK